MIKAFMSMATSKMAAPLFFIIFFFSFHCISYALIDYPIVTTANLSTSWTNRRPGTTSELTNWVLADGSNVRPIFFAREQGWSQQGTFKPAFAFGFFSNRTTSGNQLFYLVTFLLPRSDDDFILTPPVITWIANGNRPVGENATLTLTAAGDLQLRDANGILAWSTNTGSRSVSSVNFNDGNLALVDNRNRVIWRSFDTPTDAWLPTQNIGYGKRLVVPGQYYLTIARDGINGFINSNPPRRYGGRRFRSGFIRDTTILGNSGSIQALTNAARFNGGNFSADGFRYIILETKGQLNVYRLERVNSVMFNVILTGNLLAGSS